MFLFYRVCPLRVASVTHLVWVSIPVEFHSAFSMSDEVFPFDIDMMFLMFAWLFLENKSPPTPGPDVLHRARSLSSRGSRRVFLTHHQPTTLTLA